MGLDFCLGLGWVVSGGGSGVGGCFGLSVGFLNFFCFFGGVGEVCGGLVGAFIGVTVRFLHLLS